MCSFERPDLSDEVIGNTLRALYGVKLVSCSKLPGYDDYSAVVTYRPTSHEETDVRKAVIKVLGYDNSSKEHLQQFLGI